MVRWRVLSANTALTFLFFRLFFLQIVFGGCFSNIFSLTKLLHIHNLVNAARGDDSKLTYSGNTYFMSYFFVFYFIIYQSWYTMYLFDFLYKIIKIYNEKKKNQSCHILWLVEHKIKHKEWDWWFVLVRQ